MTHSTLLCTVALAGAAAFLWTMYRRQQPKMLKQMQSELYPAPSAYPMSTREHGNVYSSSQDQQDITPNATAMSDNASALHNSVDLDNAPLRHPEQQYGIQVKDNQGKMLYNANDATRSKPKRETTGGFAIQTWDYHVPAYAPGEIVYLGKGFLFERYPLSASSRYSNPGSSSWGKDGTLRLASGQEKVSTPYLPYVDWQRRRSIVTYTQDGSGLFITYNTAKPQLTQRTRSIQYLNPEGEQRIMTRVPTPSRYDAPTVKTQQGMSDFPLVFRVWRTRSDEPTLLDTAKLIVLNWDHAPILWTITAGRQFQARHAITKAAQGVPQDTFDFLTMNGERLRARIRNDNTLKFDVEDPETGIRSVQDSVTFMGPREEAFCMRLIPLRDALEMRKTHLL